MNKWKCNIKLNLEDTEYEIMNWMHLAQYRDQWWTRVNTVIKLRVP